VVVCLLRDCYLLPHVPQFYSCTTRQRCLHRLSRVSGAYAGERSACVCDRAYARSQAIGMGYPAKFSQIHMWHESCGSATTCAGHCPRYLTIPAIHLLTSAQPHTAIARLKSAESGRLQPSEATNCAEMLRSLIKFSLGDKSTTFSFCKRVLQSRSVSAW